MFEKHEVEALRDGILTLECMAMRIERESHIGGAEPCVFTGAGRIYQDDGLLRFTMYSPETYDPSRCPELIGEVGDFVGRESYYQFSAHDLEGRSWSCNAVLPSPNVPIDRRGAAWHGRLPWIRAVRHAGDLYWRAPHRTTLTCIAFQEIDAPLNYYSRSHQETPLGTVQGRSLDHAAFETAGLHCVLHAPPTHTQLVVNADAALPDNLALRMADALQFVLATPIRWAIEHGETLAEEWVTLISPGVAANRRTRIWPPVPLRTTSSVDDTWRLFALYFNRFTSDHRGALSDHVSAQWHSLLASASSTAEVQVMTAGVAVEALVKLIWSGPASAQVSPLQSIINDLLIYLKTLTTSDDLHARFEKKLQTMVEPSVMDRLHELGDKNLVDGKLLKSWRRLRNATVHDGRWLADHLEEGLDLLTDVTSLLYQIIFAAVEYSGTCTDYGRPNGIGSYPPIR